jgi:DNA-binding MarR family transcriptional regulator
VAATETLSQHSQLTRLVVTVMQVNKAVQTTLSARLEARYGLSIAEAELLVSLCQAPEGALRMHRISEALVTNRVAVTRLIDGLEAKGLVERHRPASDRRAVNAVVTPAGRAEIERVAPLMDAEIGRELGDAISGEEAAGLRAGLVKILGRLGTGPEHCEALSETTASHKGS